MGPLLVTQLLRLSLLMSDFYYDVCPRSDIYPCTCDHEGVNCNTVNTVGELQSAFNVSYKYRAIRALYMQGTNVSDIPEGTFGEVKIREVYFELNQLTSFDINLLNHSSDYTTTIALYSNNISKFAFKDLVMLPKLRSLNIASNKLTIIPNEAFGDHQTLQEIALSNNKIESIGRNAFSSLPSLKRLLLNSNPIKTLGPQAIVLHPQVKDVQINLEKCSISKISDSAFGKGFPQVLQLGKNKLPFLEEKVFQKLADEMGKYEGQIDVQSNPLTCKSCKYKWLIPDKEMLKLVIINFICPDGATMSQLTHNKINCK